MKRTDCGVTALELLMVLALATVLVAGGIPALQSLMLDLKLKAAVAGLQASLDAARGSAIQHRADAVACSGSLAAGCTGGDWHDGWLVFVDSNGDRQRQAPEHLVQQGSPLEYITARSAASRRTIRFSANGTAPASNVTINLCDRRGPDHGRRVLVSNSGRVRREQASTASPADCGPLPSP